jgi:Ca-activated chloride channel family protein
MFLLAAEIGPRPLASLGSAIRFPSLAVLALALAGCSLLSDDPADPIAIEPVDPPVAGALSIATAPDREPSQRARVIEAPLPAGEPIVRDCFGMGEMERQIGGTTSRGPQNVTPKPSRARPSTRAPRGGATGGAPAAPEAVTAAPSPMDAGSSPSTRPSPSPSPPPPPTPPLMDPGASAGGDGANDPVFGGAVGRTTTSTDQPSQKPAKRDNSDDKTQLAKEKQQEPAREIVEQKGEAEEGQGEEAKPRQQQTQVTYDWGSTVWLSNDDSMSLASAQRMLYALSRGVHLSPSEIRPHELLNYFSFDTVAPPEGQTFGVLGAAEQSGEQLTVALAVRGANPARQPLDLTVVLDRSCSMSAEDRMGYTQRGLTQLGSNLQRGDRLDIVLFDSGVCTPLENYVVGRDDPALVDNIIRRLSPTSATDLDAGLREAYRVQASRDQGDRHGRDQRVLLITDAELNSGNVNEALVSEVGSQLDQHHIRLSGVGVGREFNDRMLELLTEKGRGAYVYLGSEAVVDRVFGPGFDSLVHTVAHDVQFSLDLPDSLAMAKFYGEESSTHKEDVDPIHYHAGTTQLFLQDLAIRDGRIVRDDPIVMRIEYRDAETMEPMAQELRTTVGALLDAEPHNLRKGKALMAFADWAMAEAMGADPCSEALSTYRQRVSLVPDDAEIGFVNGLVGRRCGVPMETVALAAPAGVELKVKVDSDIPIGQVELDCGGRSHLEPLSGSDTVARFQSVLPGACTIKLDGTTPMSARVEVPSVGGDLRCMVRGGRISCG